MARIHVHWSLSEFLNLLDARSQCWGLIEVGTNGGFRVCANEQVIFHAMLEGSGTISGVGGGRIALETGDIAIIFSGAAHALRTRVSAPVQSIEFLDNDEYGDMPYHVALGGTKAARILSGRLKVRWPGGLVTYALPAGIKIDSEDNMVNLQALVKKASGNGAAALLTRAAGLILVSALRDHPQCQNMFRDANFRDPVSRAIQIMELHSQHSLTVAVLAAKVGMGRSTFAGRFLAEVGKPPMEVLTDIRMSQATRLLTQTRLKVAEICERVGYNSQSAFSRRFESYFNTTPGKMRARQLDEFSVENPTRPDPIVAGARKNAKSSSRRHAGSPPVETVVQSDWRPRDYKAAGRP